MILLAYYFAVLEPINLLNNLFIYYISRIPMTPQRAVQVLPHSQARQRSKVGQDGPRRCGHQSYAAPLLFPNKIYLFLDQSHRNDAPTNPTNPEWKSVLAVVVYPVTVTYRLYPDVECIPVKLSVRCDSVVHLKWRADTCVNLCGSGFFFRRSG